MILTFCNKDKEFYEKYDDEFSFIYPFGKNVLAQYVATEIIDKPTVGDLVKIKGTVFKVFKTMVDYDQKEIFIVVEGF